MNKQTVVEFGRELAVHERLRLHMPNANVIMSARIQGPLAPDQLSAAVASLRQRHPLLGARITLDSHHAAWFTTSGVPQIPVEVVDRQSDGHWRRVVQDEFEHAFVHEQGPLVRLVLLHSPQVSDLIINAHHTVCDGLSLAYLVGDFMTGIANPQKAPSGRLDPPPVTEQTVPVSTRGNILSRALFGLMNRQWTSRQKTVAHDVDQVPVLQANHKWSRGAQSFDAHDFALLHQAFWDKNSGQVLAWQHSENETTALVARCRQEGVTVTSAIVTAFVAAQQEVQGQAEHLREVVVSVDFRQRLTRPAGRAFGFYASGVRTGLTWTSQDSFWSAARSIHDKIQNLLTNEDIFATQQLAGLHPMLLDSLVYARHGLVNNRLSKRLMQRMGFDRVTAGLIVTNLGRLDLPLSAGPYRLEAMYGPSVCSDTMEKYLGVLTVGGRLSAMLGFSESVVDAGTVAEVRDRALALLAQAVDW